MVLNESWEAVLTTDNVFSTTHDTYVLSRNLFDRYNCLSDELIDLLAEININEALAPSDYYQIYVRVLRELCVPRENVKLLLPDIFLPPCEIALTQFASMAIRLDTGRKRGNHGNGCILTGPKGIGKSTFLHCFTIATAFVTNNTTVIYSNCSTIAQLPSELLIQAYAYDLQIDLPDLDRSNLTVVFNYLQQDPHRRKFILVLDDYNHVFKIENNEKYHQQLYLLGNHTTGQFAIFISGGDSALPSLAYANLSLESARSQGYHSYAQLSLNYERYSNVEISRITTAKEFADFVTHISESPASPLSFFTEENVLKLQSYKSKEQLSMVYTLTGGKFLAIQSFLNDPSRWVTDEVNKFLIRTEDSTFAKALRSLTAAHNKFYAMNPNDQDWGFVHVSNQDITDWNQVYRYSNDGMLCMDTSVYHVPRITFASKLHELLWRNMTAAVDTLTPYECICLLYPYGQLGIDAEMLVCKSLEENSQQFGFPGLTHALKNHLRNSNVIVCGTSDHWEKQGQHNMTTTLLQKFVNMPPLFELLREHPNKYGADVIFYDGNSVHRILIKLGTSFAKLRAFPLFLLFTISSPQGTSPPHLKIPT